VVQVLWRWCPAGTAKPLLTSFGDKWEAFGLVGAKQLSPYKAVVSFLAPALECGFHSPASFARIAGGRKT
jgi:hypothetical protein